jgi:hypothetical protein
MDVLHRLSLPERLAGLAGLAAAVASLAGFVRGLYRDPRVVIAQSHGYDVGNLVVVVVLALALRASAGGSVRGRLVTIGALGCLLYGYVTYAFLIVLNPVTLLYIAVLGCGGWAFATGLANLDAGAADDLLGPHYPRRATGAFLLILAVLFALTWLGQIAGSVTSGQLPAALKEAGWPMNPVFVLDLGFVLPLLALAGMGLLRRRAGAARLAVPLLVFMPLLALTIIAMTLADALDGQALEPAVVVLFGVVGILSTALAWAAVHPGRVAAADTSAGQARLGTA